VRAVAGVLDPLELFGHDQRHDPPAAFTLGALQVRAHVIELTVIPTASMRAPSRSSGILSGAHKPACLGIITAIDTR
jgi:hypothetical protein